MLQNIIYMEEMADGSWGATFSKTSCGRLVQVLVMLMGRTREEALEDLLVFLGARTDNDRRSILPFIVMARTEEDGEDLGEVIT